MFNDDLDASHYLHRPNVVANIVFLPVCVHYLSHYDDTVSV